MGSISRTPQIRAGLADAIGVVLSWDAVGEMGAVYIRSIGPDTVFIAFDALPAAASRGDGRFGLEPNEALNLDDISYTTIGLLCAGGETATVEAVGLIRPGNAGQGI